jgi:hypothetical protein
MQTVHELHNVNLGTHYRQQITSWELDISIVQEILPLLYVSQKLMILFKRALSSLLSPN